MRKLKNISVAIAILVSLNSCTTNLLNSAEMNDEICRPSGVQAAKLALDEWVIEPQLIAAIFLRQLPDNSQQEFIRIQLLRDGAMMLETYTTARIGKPISMKVGSKEYSAPIVQTVISEGVIRLIYDFKPGEAKKVAERIARPC